jgi:AraC family transcriptional activator of pyochelin receptor
MTTLLGLGACGDPPLPDSPLGLIFGLGDGESQPTLRLDVHPDLDTLDREGGNRFRLILLVCRPAVIRLGGQTLLSPDHTQFHLPSELRAIAPAMRDPPTTPETHSTYRLAKSIELFCEALRLFADNALAPLAGGGALSQADTRRLLAARRMIDDRWHEKLTLDAIARACGLNRAKLTRGFREMFDCSIAEAIAERRLDQASRLLRTTDLLVSSVGYESGYLNNASFSRAFSRHFGRSPSDYRAGLAA